MSTWVREIPLIVLLIALPAAPAALAGDEFSEDDVVTVELQDMQFQPEVLQIPAGTVVRFVNKDPLEHDVVQAVPDEVAGMGHHHADEDHDGPVHADSSGFHSPHLDDRGDSWEVKFTEAGEYPILCTVDDHFKAGMVGRIVVSE